MKIKNVWERFGRMGSILLILGVIVFLFAKERTHSPISSTAEESSVNQEEVDAYALKIYKQLDAGLNASIDDKKFVAFIQETIDKKCPFYEPNGAEYRECLYNWSDKLRTQINQKTLDAVDEYCDGFVRKYSDADTLEGIELYAKCEIYELTYRIK